MLKFKFFGYLFLITVSFITIISVGVFLLSLSVGLMTEKKMIVPDIEVLKRVQKVYYRGGFRNIWQYNEDCYELDEDLIYKPKIGKCNFENVEFKTILNFDENGRIHNSSFNKNFKKIAVLGDSHGMGWGVNDDETFSNLLQNFTQRKVYNLSVSSYATEIQIKSFLKHPDIDNIDTVIIQYDFGDLRDNLKFPIDTKLASKIYNEKRKNYLEIQKKALKRNFEFAVRAIISHYMPNKIKSFLKTYVIKNNKNTITIDDKEHKKNILIILKYYQEYLKDKKIIIFFTSGNGNTETPSNWIENNEYSTLDIEFIDIKLSNDNYFIIDDHINKKGHEVLAYKLLNKI